VFLWEGDHNVYVPIYNLDIGDSRTTTLSTRIPTVPEFLDHLYKYSITDGVQPVDAHTLIRLEEEPDILTSYSKLYAIQLPQYIRGIAIPIDNICYRYCIHNREI